jgi:cytochrome oxidase Cu insertion factor (SCO1/SenC/PrrC family)
VVGVRGDAGRHLGHPERPEETGAQTGSRLEGTVIVSLAADRLRARNLRTVLALAALFLLPVAASFWLYYGVGWRPAGRTNHGELIEPARPLPAASFPATDGRGVVSNVFSGQWTLVYIGNGACDSACQHALYVMRQTRAGLNNDMSRVKRVFLVTSGCCDRTYLAREHPGLIALDASGAEAQRVVGQFPGADLESTLFVVDPLGNLMMRYDARRNPKGLLEDLKKLLRLSHIG